MRIDVGNLSSVREITEQMEFLEEAERKKVLQAFRRARSRVLSIYGADAAAKLAEDFRLEKSFVRNLRLFRNAKRARVWVGGNRMSLGRYEDVEETPGGVSVGRFGVIPGAFIISVSGVDLVFAPDTVALPGWATFSGKAWKPRSDKRSLRKIAVREPENFQARYAPDAAAVRAKFEAEFLKNLEKL